MQQDTYGMDFKCHLCEYVRDLVPDHSQQCFHIFKGVCWYSCARWDEITAPVIYSIKAKQKKDGWHYTSIKCSEFKKKEVMDQ